MSSQTVAVWQWQPCIRFKFRVSLMYKITVTAYIIIIVYNNYSYKVTIWLLLLLLFFFSPVADNTIVVEIRENRPPTLGIYYSLTCDVSAVEVPSSSRTYQWTQTNSTNDNVHIGSDSPQIHFNNLKRYEAGEYTCTVTISSPFLTEMVSRMSSHTVTIPRE